MILRLVDEVLGESNFKLKQLDGLAFGRGPGSFTGVRIAVGVIQGLALASQLPVVGISDLAAVAQRVATEQSLAADDRILVCMDARMQEVYWALYVMLSTGSVDLSGAESVAPPESVRVDGSHIRFGAGTAWRQYPQLRSHYTGLAVDDTVLPRAREIAHLAVAEFNAGRVVHAGEAQPVYLRDQVAWPTQK
jgi:tRNA threonylcarbamoyladenosine biosynthesis protein TsaB